MDRRKFIGNTAASMVGLSFLSFADLAKNNKISRDIGIQLYTLAKPLSADFEGTLKKVAEFGYKNVEFAGPYYFSPQEEIANNPLIKMGLPGYGYYKHTPKEIKMMLDDLGLKSTSAHISDGTLNHNIDEAINAAKIIGQEYILSPMFIGQSLDDYKLVAESYNKFGEKCKSAGIKYGYHTHSHEFQDFNGLTAFEVLVNETDPTSVFFELDLFWATVAGVDPISLINKFPGRITLLHIKELANELDKNYNTNETFLNMEIAMKLLKKQTIVGEGIIDFKSIIEGVANTSVEHLIIESDFPENPMAFAEKSLINFKKMI